MTGGRRVGILGVGAVGVRIARQLLATHADTEVILQDPDTAKVQEAARTLGRSAAVLLEGDLVDQGIDLLIVAAPTGHHLGPIRQCVRVGLPAISTSDRIDEVDALLALDAQAKVAKVSVVLGAGFAPGLTCVLASFLGERFDSVTEVHVAKQGTGGPACARQHHRALSSAAHDWRDGGWVRRAGGSGRELVWFPEPIGGSDCYRAGLIDAKLLKPRFADAVRITARIAASRQDRFTSWLPMLTPPHPEGAVGAIRLEIRGLIEGRQVVQVVGAAERPAIAAAAVAATAADAVLHSNTVAFGASGLAESVAAGDFLRALARRGVRAQEFRGPDHD